MIVVFWLFDNEPQHIRFDDNQLTNALAYMEELREARKIGSRISHVTMCSENPNQVGSMGVGETTADYNWTKRRGGSNKVRAVDIEKYKDF